MKLQEMQKQKAQKSIYLHNKKTNSRNIEQANKSESITQAQTENLINHKSLPDPRLIIVSTLMLASLLFVAAIYYGIINP